jgi:hypothetical protein
MNQRRSVTLRDSKFVIHGVDTEIRSVKAAVDCLNVSIR